MHVQVDAVLCREPLPVSADVGAWKLVNEFPRGVWIHGTGVWGTGKLVVKRMGMNEREAEQWLIHKT
jgi:N-dimethylarginine dimethylaminohydrolase